MPTTSRILKLRKDRDSIPFSSYAKLLAGQGADEYVTSEMLIPYMTAKLTEYETNLIAGAPDALNNLNEIAQRLAQLGTSDSQIEVMMASIVGTMATTTYVNGELVLKANSSDVTALMALVNTRISEETARVNSALSEKVATTTLTSELLNLSQNVLPLKSNVTDFTAEQARVNTALDLKADITYVDSELAAVVLWEQERIDPIVATKTTEAQVIVIAQGLIDAYNTFLLNGVGADADTLKELNDKLVALQALSTADLNGVIALVATKVDKTVFDAFVLSVYTKTQIDAKMLLKANQADLTAEIGTRTSEIARIDGSVALKASQVNLDAEASARATEDTRLGNSIQQAVLALTMSIGQKASQSDLLSEVSTRTSEISRVEAAYQAGISSTNANVTVVGNNLADLLLNFQNYVVSQAQIITDLTQRVVDLEAMTVQQPS